MFLLLQVWELISKRTPHEMIGNWFPVKMAEIEVCCSSDDSEQKFSWHQLSKMILNQSKRHTMGKIGQFCPKIVELLTRTTAGNGT